MKKQNKFKYNKEPGIFKIVFKNVDLSGNPYTLKFEYENKKIFWLMYSDFRTHIEKGKIIFAD